jgi:branched-chain amino acid transport system substrate-binding protein
VTRIRMRAVAALSAAALVASGCGVRRSEADIAAAARGGLPPASGPLSAPPAVSGAADSRPGSDGATAGAPSGSADAAGAGTAAGGSSSPGAPTAPTLSASAGTAAGPGHGPAAGRSAVSGSSRTDRAAAAGNPARADVPPGPEMSAAAPAEAGSPGAPDAGAGRLSPVKVGNVSTLGGVVGSTLGDSVTALTAWSRSVNDRGGLNGHPVELFIADDGGDPARHRALHQQLHEEKGVIAFLAPAAPLSGQTAVDYVTRKRLPVVGDVGASTWGYTSPMYFPQLSMGDALPAAWFGTAKTAADATGKRKLGFISCAEAQVCRDGDRLAAQLAGKFGLDLVYKAQTSVAQPDFTGECVGARNAGVDVFIVISDTNSVIRTIRSCKQIGFSPVFVTQHATGATILEDPNTDGVWIGAPLRPYTATGFPGLDEYRAEMQRYAPKTLNLTGELGWSAGKLLELATAHLPEPPTSPAILDGLWQIHDETLGGFTYPLTFNRDQNPAKISCWVPAQIQNKKPVDRSGGRTDCLQ